CTEKDWWKRIQPGKRFPFKIDKSHRADIINTVYDNPVGGKSNSIFILRLRSFSSCLIWPAHALPFWTLKQPVSPHGLATVSVKWELSSVKENGSGNSTNNS